MTTHIIILGAQGMLGSYLTAYLQKAWPCFKVHPITRDRFEVPKSIEGVKEFANQFGLRIPFEDKVWVLNAVGITDQISGEDNSEFYRVNGEYSHWWNEVCEAKKWIYVYFSTDCVFSGQVSNPPTEQVDPDAVDTYGKSKIAGECGMVIRASIIGEDARHYRGFIEFAKRNHHQTVTGYTNHLWNGITCLTMAEYIAHTIFWNQEWVGIKHLVPGYEVSKYEMLKMVNEVWELNLNIMPQEAPIAKNMILASDNKPNLRDFMMMDEKSVKVKSNFEFSDLKTQLINLKKWRPIPNEQNVFRKVLMIGGSGSLGQALIDQWQHRMSQCIVFSRGEHKQWELSQKFPRVKFEMELGDVDDSKRLAQVVQQHNPDTIIYAAAMKHVDRCERAVRQCIRTNCLGFLNLLEVTQDWVNLNGTSQNLKKILYVSTDKACHPINIYGMTKGIGEHLVQRYYIPCVTVLGVRYGNVIDSSGTIIQVLKRQGQDPTYSSFTLTDPEMTRFYMTSSQTVQLIEDCLVYGRSGELWIPKLQSMSIKTLFEIFAKKYEKPIRLVGIRLGEKVHESLLDVHELPYTREYQVENRTSFIVSNKPTDKAAKNYKKHQWKYSSSDNLIDMYELTRLLDKDGML
jgi:dTDP-4-dehydrorhamnose reductase